MLFAVLRDSSGARLVKSKVFNLQEQERGESDEDNECGRAKTATAFILGGKDEVSSDWPWVAAMYVLAQYTCNANYISRTRAVSAAHCFRRGLDPADIELYIFAEKSK